MAAAEGDKRDESMQTLQAGSDTEFVSIRHHGKAALRGHVSVRV